MTYLSYRRVKMMTIMGMKVKVMMKGLTMTMIMRIGFFPCLKVFGRKGVGLRQPLPPAALRQR